jgi:aryl-alcohol dehydrogenase-like predicted oxidoreductase
MNSDINNWDPYSAPGGVLIYNAYIEKLYADNWTLNPSDKYNWERFITFQGRYSLIARELENELVPLCLDQGLGILTFKPLAGGFLSGKYRRGMPRPKDARLSETNLGFDEQQAYNIVDVLDRVATAHDATVTQAALNYLLCKPGISSVIVGTRTPKQIADNLKSTYWEMLPGEVAQLDKVSKPALLYPYDFLEHVLKD